METLNHPNVVHGIEHIKLKINGIKYFVIIMKFYVNGNVQAYVTKKY